MIPLAWYVYLAEPGGNSWALTWSLSGQFGQVSGSHGTMSHFLLCFFLRLLLMNCILWCADWISTKFPPDLDVSKIWLWYRYNFSIARCSLLSAGFSLLSEHHSALLSYPGAGNFSNLSMRWIWFTFCNVGQNHNINVDWIRWRNWNKIYLNW